MAAKTTKAITWDDLEDNIGHMITVIAVLVEIDIFCSYTANIEINRLFVLKTSG